MVHSVAAPKRNEARSKCRMMRPIDLIPPVSEVPKLITKQDRRVAPVASRITVHISASMKGIFLEEVAFGAPLVDAIGSIPML